MSRASLRPALRQEMHGGVRAYYKRVLALGPIAYWPQWEASGSVAYDVSGNGRNGAYTGVALGQAGIGDGRSAPYYDGITDYTDIYSAGLAADFNSSLGTMACWMRVLNAGVWTDGTYRNVMRLQANGSNYVDLMKTNVNNIFQLNYRSGAVSHVRNVAVAATDWMFWAITWDKATDEVRPYLNGVQQGATLTGLGIWAGALDATTCCIGAASTVPATPWSGWLAHAVVFDRALTPTQVAMMARI